MKKKVKDVVTKTKKLAKNNSSLLIKIGIALLAFLTILLIIIASKRLTKLERVKLNEASNDVVTYLDEVVESKDEGRYISYAIEYLYNEKGKENVTTEEILNVINSKFNVDYNTDDINKIGISERMASKGITYDVANKSYKYSNSKTKVDIANEKIITYEIKKIQKNNKNKFKVKYTRFVIDNPYEILNYYNDYNIKRSQEGKELFDTNKITEYLKGNGKIKDIKELLNNKNLKKIGKTKGEVTVTYIIKDDKLLIDEIK